MNINIVINISSTITMLSVLTTYLPNGKLLQRFEVSSY